MMKLGLMYGWAGLGRKVCLLGLAGICMLLGGCAQEVLGLTRAERFALYEAALVAAGHGELAVPVALAGRALGKAPRGGVQPGD